MIERIKTITYEVRSHGQRTVISSGGTILNGYWDINKLEFIKSKKVVIKKTIWHLQDVLKLLNKLEREKGVKSDMQNNQGKRAGEVSQGKRE